MKEEREELNNSNKNFGSKNAEWTKKRNLIFSFLFFL